ncbi:Hypothetical predicted protein, partial [Marmota monax]
LWGLGPLGPSIWVDDGAPGDTLQPTSYLLDKPLPSLFPVRWITELLTLSPVATLSQFFPESGHQ